MSLLQLRLFIKISSDFLSIMDAILLGRITSIPIKIDYHPLQSIVTCCNKKLLRMTAIGKVEEERLNPFSGYNDIFPSYTGISTNNITTVMVLEENGCRMRIIIEDVEHVDTKRVFTLNRVDNNWYRGDLHHEERLYDSNISNEYVWTINPYVWTKEKMDIIRIEDEVINIIESSHDISVFSNKEQYCYLNNEFDLLDLLEGSTLTDIMKEAIDMIRSHK